MFVMDGAGMVELIQMSDTQRDVRKEEEGTKKEKMKHGIEVSFSQFSLFRGIELEISQQVTWNGTLPNSELLRKKMIKNGHGNEIFGNRSAIWDKKRPFLWDEIRLRSLFYCVTTVTRWSSLPYKWTPGEEKQNILYI